MLALIPLLSILAPALTLAAPIINATTSIGANFNSTLSCTPYLFNGTNTTATLYAVSRTTTQGGRVPSTFKVATVLDGQAPLQADYDFPTEGSPFGFETCSVSMNTTFAVEVYGHITYTNVSQNTTLCLSSTTANNSESLENSTLALTECEYDQNAATSSGQYWFLQDESNALTVYLYGGSEENVYGPTPEIASNASLTLASSLLDGTDGTFFTFLA